MTLGALVNQLRPRGEYDSPNTAANLLAAAGGLGTAAYGLSGNQFHNVLPTIKKIFGHKPLSTTQQQQVPVATSNSVAARDPRLAKYINNDGSFRFRDIVAAPDDELRQAVGLLSPAERKEMQARLQNFKPSMAQRLGARATGIDIEHQRGRFANLLGQ